MIPKIIHYCWFGHGDFDKKTKKCMDSWKKHFPDYEIREWNEKNFDISMMSYTEQAYKAKKWAFVSDVARLYALYTCGGIYFDTDVEVVKSFDDLLDGQTVFGLETPKSVATCVMIAQKGDSLIKELLDDYQQRVFLKEDGTYDYTPNPKHLTDKLVGKGFVLDDRKQVVNNIMCLPVECFSPFDYEGNPINYTNNTYSIHHFAATWWPTYRIKDKKKMNNPIRILCGKIKQLFNRLTNKCIRIVGHFNPLLQNVLEEQGLRRFKSYRLSKRYGGKIFVYKNCHVSISPTAIVEVDGILKIGVFWENFKPETTNFIISDNATLLVKGNFRISSGSRVSVNKDAKLILGNNGLLNFNVNIRCFDQIVIGDDVRISENCTISDSDNHTIYFDNKTTSMHSPIHIQNHCLIALNCTILKGVTIEEGAMVAAGSVVNRNVKSKTLVGGVPIKVIRENIKWSI